MFRLGVTGGIGSGKSTICKIFSVLGVPYFSADDCARIIIEKNRVVHNSLNHLTGVELFSGGVLNRQKLAQIIFSDTVLLNKVNSLVHPYVFKAFDSWCNEQDAKYVIFEAAILFESGGEKYTDKIAVVIAPTEERIMRVIERNMMKRDEVLARIKNQIDESDLISRSDFVIDNSDNRMVIPQVLHLHNDLLDIIRE